MRKKLPINEQRRLYQLLRDELRPFGPASQVFFDNDGVVVSYAVLYSLPEDSMYKSIAFDQAHGILPEYGSVIYN